ncbi:MAG TPA: AmmeMemoRadiSam system protein B [Draconibacterium sp.]|nr:AmmeMemoRadiSam system protein B [Draconibacterium sp.]
MKDGPIRNKNNRGAAFAGKFYPGTKPELTLQLEDLFEQAKEHVADRLTLRAIIAPHAGYVFSGGVAASAYNQIPTNAHYKHIFVLASSHRYHFGGASVFNRGNYVTPLGEIKVDQELASQLIDSSSVFFDNNEAHLYEHSLEVQLPFLQHRLGENILLVPIILGTGDAKVCKKIADVLRPWFTPDNLFVVSTDFSHYPEYNDANKVDYITAQAICRNQPEHLQEVLEENKKMRIKNLATSLCGWTSVLTLLYLTEKEKVQYKKTDYRNSGDSKTYGEKDQVVGYWAITVFDEPESFQISEIEKKELLAKARSSITHFLETGKKGEPKPPEAGGILNESAGVFVSIYVNNKLRGCIGSFVAEDTLNDQVQNIAVSAACDHRFDDLKPDDLENMELEISVLSPLKKIESTEEIELGKHGIYIKKGYNTGTFLPQVATKTGWNLTEFLGHCSRDKAGLGWDGWKSAELFTYEAFVFRGK